MEVIIVLLLIVVVVALLARAFVSVITVRDYQRGLHYRQGKLVGLLSTGTHIAIRPISEIQLLDARPTQMTVPGQEILTADGVALKISLTAQYVVADPVAALTNDQSWGAALYAALHAGLRDAMVSDGHAWSELLASEPDPDRVVTEVDDKDGSELDAVMGVRLAQTLHHGTDHRSQICTAMTSLGVEPPGIDVWEYGFATGRVAERKAGDR